MTVGSFFAKLFDLSFEEFITPTIIRIVYIITIALAALYALGILLWLASTGGAVGAVLGLILAPLVFILALLMSRILLEVMLVLFRIAEDTQRIASEMGPDAPTDESGARLGRQGSTGPNPGERRLASADGRL